METKATNEKSNSLDNITLAEAIKAVETLKKIKDWANQDNSWLSRRTEYANGYANGIFQAQNIILNIIDSKE